MPTKKESFQELHQRALELAAILRPHYELEESRLDEDDLELLRLENASNEIVELIELGRLDEAEAAAKELSIEYPDQIDGIDRLAMVCEAKGEFARAIQLHEEAITFSLAHEGFDEESRSYHREKIGELNAKLPRGSIQLD